MAKRMTGVERQLKYMKTVEEIRVTVPRGTKKRLQKQGIENVSAYIRGLIEIDIEKRETGEIVMPPILISSLK